MKSGNLCIEEFMHGYCEYLSLAFAKLYGNKIEVWADIDYDMGDDGELILCHSYNEIISGLYIDANGLFRSIKDISDEFEYNEVYIYTYNTLDEAKAFFKKLKVPYTDKVLKDWIKEFLWTHAPVITLNTNNDIMRIAYEGITYNENLVPMMMFRKLYDNNVIGSKHYAPAVTIKNSIDFKFSDEGERILNHNFEWVKVDNWHDILKKDRKC